MTKAKTSGITSAKTTAKEQSMVTLRNFIFFVSLTALALIANLQSIEGYLYFIFSSIVLMGAILVGCRTAPHFANQAIIFIVGEVGSNNNLRFYIWCVLSLICFICGLANGPGEPIIQSSWRSMGEIISKEQKEGLSRSKNRIIQGLSLTGPEIENLKAKIKEMQQDPASPLLIFATNRKIWTGEDMGDYAERKKNWYILGVFAKNDDIASMTAGYVLKNSPAPTPSQVIKTWFWWKLGFTYLFLAIIYAPFAFRDETISFFEGIAEKIETFNRDYKDKVRVAAKGEEAASTAASVFPDRLGVFSRLFQTLYTSDMAAQFTIHILQSMTKFLRR